MKNVECVRLRCVRSVMRVERAHRVCKLNESRSKRTFFDESFDFEFESKTPWRSEESCEAADKLVLHSIHRA